MCAGVRRSSVGPTAAPPCRRDTRRPIPEPRGSPGSASAGGPHRASSERRRQPPSLGLSISSLPEPRCLVGGGGGNGLRGQAAARSGALQLPVRHGRAGALQRRRRLIGLRFSSDFLSPKIESFSSERCRNEQTPPAPTRACGWGRGARQWVHAAPRSARLPSGPCKEAFGTSEPDLLLEFAVKKTPWQSLGGYF